MSLTTKKNKELNLVPKRGPDTLSTINQNRPSLKVLVQSLGTGKPGLLSISLCGSDLINMVTSAELFMCWLSSQDEHPKKKTRQRICFP